MGNYLVPLEFEVVGSVLIDCLLDDSACLLEEALSLRHLGGEVGQHLPDRWEAAVCDHQLLIQLMDTSQHWKHNQKYKPILYSFTISVSFW